MTFSHYEALPNQLAQRVIEAYQQSREQKK